MANKYGIPTDYNDPLIQDFITTSKESLAAKQAADQDVLQTNQSLMYDALGRMQLQTERDIAKRRIQAQRSGMTSSQLAAFEMQDLLTGQMGAQQIANQYATEQAALRSKYAGAEADIKTGLFETLISGRANVAALDTERFTASAIEQMKTLYPDATQEQLNILARSYLGLELENYEKDILEELLNTNKIVNPTSAVTNQPVAVNNTGNLSETVESADWWKIMGALGS